MPRSIPSFSSLRRSRRSQRGVALYVVIVFVMLSMLLASWAARGSLFNEIVVGNDADYRRAFEAAQAMLQDAEFDIRGVRPSGEACLPSDTSTDVCRAGTAVFFDIETKDLEGVLAVVRANGATTGCYKGICEKRVGAQDFWNSKTVLEAMTANDVGARYGQFTGADAGDKSNPLLNVRSAGRGAWYWVEILPYIDPSVALLSNMPDDSNVDRFAPSRKKLMVYRITAIARGNKPSTEVVLQSVLSIQSVD